MKRITAVETTIYGYEDGNTHKLHSSIEYSLLGLERVVAHLLEGLKFRKDTYGVADRVQVGMEHSETMRTLQYWAQSPTGRQYCINVFVKSETIWQGRMITQALWQADSLAAVFEEDAS